jgi:RsiW-degrading membrane proteinase PrsW (M82 family)
LSLLLKNFLWGAIGAIVFGIVFSIIFSSALGTNEFHNAIFIAPFVEEIAKGIFLLYTARDRRFDNITDGVVYGTAIGLGFGMTENFLYFMGATGVDQWVFLVIVRTLFSAVMHAMATGTFGAFVGFTKFQKPSLRLPLRLVGLFVAMFMHFFWNYSVSIEDPAAAGIGAIFIILSVIVMIIVFQLSLLSESRLIQRELAEETTEGIIPANHLQFLPYSSKRRLIGWLPVNMDRKAYIQLATNLAFRKFQSKYCSERERESYVEEVQRLREQIRQLIHTEQQSVASKLF